MKKNVFVSLLIVTIVFPVILIIGCGGGTDNIITSPSISNQDPITGAYLHITVTWPQNGSVGKCNMSSGKEESTITASMPADTKQIIVKVRQAIDPNDPDAPADDPNSYLKNGYAEILAPQNKVTIGPLPAIKVKVRAETYDRYGPLLPEQAISIVEKEFQLYVLSENEIAMPLGDYELTLTANPDTIGGSTVKGSNLISSAIAVPSPAISYITANLNIVYPTPAPNSTATSKPPKPVKGKSIKFAIIDGNYEGTYLSLSDESGSIVTGQTVTGKTDDDGTSTVTLETDTLESKTVKVKASFEADSNDPNSIYSDYCNVTVIVPPTPIPLPTETPAPTFTPTPTLTPTITPTPTQTPTPPPFPSYVLGTWKELTGDVKETGNTFTVEFTEPYQYKDHLTKVKIIKNGDSNNAYYGWVWYCDESSGQVYWPEDTTSIMPNSESYYTCFGILYKYKSIVPGASSAICWAKKANGTYMCYWSR